MKLVDNNVTIDKVLNSTSKTEVTHEDLVISVRYLLGLRNSDEPSIYNTENYVGGDGYNPSSPNIDLSNYVDIDSAQNITGIKTFQNGLIIGTVKIVDDGDGLHIYKGLRSDSFITAYGKSEGGSGSSTGPGSYERLDAWSQWKAGETDTYVLSAKLGVELYTNRLQLATPGVWNDSTYNSSHALSASMAVTKFNEVINKIDNSSITINGTSVKLGGTFRTANITAGTAGTSSATSGYTLSVPYVTTNAYGIITGYGTHTHTVNNIPNSSLQHSTIGIAGTDVSLGSSITKSTLLSNLGLSGTSTAWGQTYWNAGPVTISGNLYSVGTVYFGTNSTSTPKLYYDSTNKCLRTNVAIVSESFISAYGVSASSAITSNGGHITNGHLYLDGAVDNSSTSNVTQIIFRANGDQQVAISSNKNELIINPNSNGTNGQIELGVNGGNTRFRSDTSKVAIRGYLRVGTEYVESDWDSWRLYVNGTACVSSTFNCKGNIQLNGSTIHSSDIRLKNIEENVLLNIKDVADAPCFKFSFKDDENKLLRIGSSAQYWKNILPDTVSEDDQGWLGLDYTAVTFASVVSLAKRSESHEERIKKLEAENKELKNQIEKFNTYGT